MIVPLTPVMFLRRAEKLFPQKVGVVCEGRRFSYAEFGGRVHRLSNALAVLKVQKNDVVAYLGHNCHRLLEAYYGFAISSTTPKPKYYFLNPSSIQRLIRFESSCNAK